MTEEKHTRDTMASTHFLALPYANTGTLEVTAQATFI